MATGHLLLFVFSICIVPALQQAWNPPSNAQPSWQNPAPAPQQVQAQPVQPAQPAWNQPAQQPGPQPWGAAQPAANAPPAAQTSVWNQQTQAQPQPQPQPQPATGNTAAESKTTQKGSGVGVRMLPIKPGDGKLYSNGQQFDSSLERNEPFTFTLGVGQVIRGWDIAVAHLTLGQKARFTVGPEYAYGEQGIKGYPF
ncbi:FKBP1 [Mytilus edulis]|uniref:peptidylprolyl isomerase n=1 Tax=Mytilus edulis TaxID=6550 RepID=A0A8S3RUB4_MYTED|nr:FKBP1 [Mytilus edulis]